jgi:hypothetical protein
MAFSPESIDDEFADFKIQSPILDMSVGVKIYDGKFFEMEPRSGRKKYASFKNFLANKNPMLRTKTRFRPRPGKNIQIVGTKLEEINPKEIPFFDPEEIILDDDIDDYLMIDPEIEALCARLHLN